MHARATAAGLDPYGSSPAQMHVVDHVEDREAWAAAGGVTNEWQSFWEASGLPKLLKLLEASTHSAFEGIEGDRVQ